MQSFAVLALFVASALGQALTINTPSNVVECEPTLLNWTGGVPPYFLSIQPGNQPSAAALESLGTQTGNSYTWSTDIAAGTSIGLSIRDSTGATAQSAAFTINAGSSACLSSSAAGSATGSASASSSASGSASSSAASSSKPASVSSSAAPSSSAGSSSAPAPVSSSVASVGSSSSSKAASSAASSSASATNTAAGGSSTGAASMSHANMGVAAVAGAAVMALLA